MAKVWKLLHSPFQRYPTAFSQNIFLHREWLTFLLAAPEMPISKFSGVLNTMANVWKLWLSLYAEIIHIIFSKHILAWESGFLSFLELQKCLLVSFLREYWAQWQMFESSSIHCMLRYPSAFSQNIFLLWKWLSFIFRTPEMPTSQFSEVLNPMANVWKL